MKKAASTSLSDLYGVMGKRFFDSTPVGMVMISKKGKFLQANRAFCAFLGYSRRELLSKTVRVITHPADRKKSAQVIRGAGSSPPVSAKLEKRYLHKSGKVVWGEVHTRLVRDPRSKTSYAIAQVIDITNWKVAEQDLQQEKTAYKALADNAPDMIVRFDRKLRHLYVNLATEKIAGRFSRDFIGKTNKDLGVPPHLEIIGSRTLRRLLRTRQTQNIEFEMATPQGPRAFESRIAPEFAADGSVKNMVCVTRDVTEQKRLKDALQRSHAELESKVEDRTRRLRDLAGEISRIEQRERHRIAHILHENLQQVLVAIQFQLSEAPQISPDRILRENNAQALEMINSALTITRNLCVDLTPPVLHDLGLKAALEWLAGEMRTKMGLTVILSAFPQFRLGCDDLRAFAFTAIREFLTNVIKHAQVKTASIQIHKLNQNTIKVEIRDSGVGFNPHLENSPTFGLFSIRERAIALGCRLDIDSTPGQGTCIRLTIPIAE